MRDGLKKFSKSQRDLGSTDRLRPSKTAGHNERKINGEGCLEEAGTASQSRFCRYCEYMPGEGRLIIEVVDQGCGISEEGQKRLFQPFSQCNKSIYSKFGGTGLGLWISHKLAQAMNGSITCSSILSHGTTFSVTVPVKCKANNPLNEGISWLPELQTLFAETKIMVLMKKQQEVKAALAAAGVKCFPCYSVDYLCAQLQVPTRYSENLS